MTKSSGTKTSNKLQARLVCVLLSVMCALALCAAGVGFTARAAETVVDGQTVDSNGFRLTYAAQGLDRRNVDGEKKYDDTMDDLTSKIRLTPGAVGVDNWGKPIDFSKRFRVHLSSMSDDNESAKREWTIFDIATTTDAANVNAVQGWNTLEVSGNDNYNQPIQPDSIIHFISNHKKAYTPIAANSNVMWNVRSKGFATDNVDGSVHVGFADYGRERREYIYTFDIVSGDVEGERSTLTASANMTDAYLSKGSDTFYLTMTQKDLVGKVGYFSANFNGEQYDLYVKLVQENTLTINCETGYAVTEIKTRNCGYDTDVTVSNSPKIWGGDLIKMKLSGESAMIMVGETPVLEGEDGYWSFYMPDADTEITVKEADKYYTVNFDTNGGSVVMSQSVPEDGTLTEPTAPTKAGYVFAGWYTDTGLTTAYDFETVVSEAFTLYAKWTKLHAVTYKINGFKDLSASVVDNEKAPEKTMSNGVRPSTVATARLPGWSADNLSLVWYKDAEFTEAYDFDTAVTEDMTLYGKLIETKQYKNTGAYGWDELTTFTDDSGTKIINSEHYAKPFDISDDGTATFNLTDQQEAIYSRALDVTKPIYFDLALTTANGHWFMVGLWDNLTLAQISYSDNYEHSYGVQACFGMNSATGVVHEGDGSNYDGTFADAVGGNTAHLKIEIGEEASVIYKYKDEAWAKYADFNVKRSDFRNGKAYMSMAPFVACQAEMKVWQEIDPAKVTASGDENGTVTATVVGGGSAIKVEYAPNDGFELDTVTVNGKKGKVNKKGLVTFEDYAEANAGIEVKATFKASKAPDEGDKDKDKDKDKDQNNTGCSCKSAMGGVGTVGAAVAMLAVAGIVLIVRRKKAND